MQSNASYTLGNVQGLRALAATAVVFYHTNYNIPGIFHTDYLGVPIFFVISGFIMSYIRRVDCGEFVRHRITRIVPTYWLATFLFAVLVVLVYPIMHKPTDNIVTMSTFLRDLFFIPRFENDGTMIFPVDGVGWTLNLEMFFYLAFAIAILINKTHAPLLTALPLFALWALARLMDAGAVLNFYGHKFVIFFVFGILIFYLTQWHARPKFLIACTSVSVGFALLIVYIMTLNEFAFLIAPPLIVLGAIEFDLQSRAILPRLIANLGAASYAIYLFHPFVSGFVKQFGFDLKNVVLTIAASIALGVLIYRYVEAPLISWFRIHWPRSLAVAKPPQAAINPE